MITPGTQDSDKTISGIGYGSLSAIGRIHYYRKESIKALVIKSDSENDTAHELSRLQIAFAEENEDNVSGELYEFAKKHIFEGANAEEAVSEAWKEAADRTGNKAERILSSKTKQIRKKAASILRSLNDTSAGERKKGSYLMLCSPVILASDNISAAELADLDENMILGIILGTKSPVSEEARTAQSFSVPLLTGVNISLLESEAPEGKNIVLDAKKGLVFISEPVLEVEEYARRIGKIAEESTKAEKSIRTINEIRRRPQLDVLHEEEIVLFCENLVDENPSEDDFYELFCKGEASSQSGKVMLHLLGTKDLNEEEKIKESVLRAELRALIRASEKGSFSIILKNVLSPDEVKHVRAVMTEEANGLSLTERVKEIMVGALAESPAAILYSAELVGVCDFIVFDTDSLLATSLGKKKSEIENNEIGENSKILRRLIHIALYPASTKGIEVGLCGYAAAASEIPYFLVPGDGFFMFDVSQSKFFFILPQNHAD